MKDERQLDSDDAVQANRNYKDTVFRMLFSDRANLLSLYNAVTGYAYDNPDELQIVTLENAIYMGMKNDLAFVFDTGIYLYEHQSTVNPNIPLRDLFYISAEYSKLVEKKSLYSSAVSSSTVSPSTGMTNCWTILSPQYTIPCSLSFPKYCNDKCTCPM